MTLYDMMSELQRLNDRSRAARGQHDPIVNNSRTAGCPCHQPLFGQHQRYDCFGRYPQHPLVSGLPSHFQCVPGIRGVPDNRLGRECNHRFDSDVVAKGVLYSRTCILPLPSGLDTIVRITGPTIKCWQFKYTRQL